MSPLESFSRPFMRSLRVMMPASWPPASTIGVPWRRARSGSRRIRSASSRRLVAVEIVATRRSITSPTRCTSKGSTVYSRKTWCPRRATFSVRIERRIRSTVTAWAHVQATSSVGRRFQSRVSSAVNSMAVRGERIVPPMIAAMPTVAQSPVPPCGSSEEKRAPREPPIIRRGARTPPEVPEPSAKDQTTALVTARRAAEPAGTEPPSSPWIDS